MGEEKLFLSFKVLKPWMPRKLLKKIPGLEIMNRFQTKRHVSCPEHWLYAEHSKCLCSQHLNWRWKTRSRPRESCGEWKFKNKGACKSKPKYTPAFSPKWSSTLIIYMLCPWTKSECCQTRPVLSISHKLCPSHLPGFLAHSLPQACDRRWDGRCGSPGHLQLRILR